MSLLLRRILANVARGGDDGTDACKGIVAIVAPSNLLLSHFGVEPPKVVAAVIVAVLLPPPGPHFQIFANVTVVILIIPTKCQYQVLKLIRGERQQQQRNLVPTPTKLPAWLLLPLYLTLSSISRASRIS
jgi:hypothetical protein